MARFRSRARGDSRSALALSRKASRPPLWSTLFTALVETRRRTLRSRASLMKVTLTRFGRKRRLVLMLEWLTLWPTWGPLAVSSQRRDMASILEFDPPTRAAAILGAPGANFVSLKGAGGRIGGKGRVVKDLGGVLGPPRPRCAPSPACGGGLGGASAMGQSLVSPGG